MTKTNLFAQHPEINLRKKIHELHLPDNGQLDNNQLIGREDIWLIVYHTDSANTDLNSGKTKSE